jgi:hypothetical protein
MPPGWPPFGVLRVVLIPGAGPVVGAVGVKRELM